ncbi:hypothetical protein QBC39DRAFT_385981, partial [Podospora conica]
MSNAGGSEASSLTSSHYSVEELVRRGATARQIARAKMRMEMREAAERQKKEKGKNSPGMTDIRDQTALRSPGRAPGSPGRLHPKHRTAMSPPNPPDTTQGGRAPQPRAVMSPLRSPGINIRDETAPLGPPKHQASKPMPLGLRSPRKPSPATSIREEADRLRQVASARPPPQQSPRRQLPLPPLPAATAHARAPPRGTQAPQYRAEPNHHSLRDRLSHESSRSQKKATADTPSPSETLHRLFWKTWSAVRFFCKGLRWVIGVLICMVEPVVQWYVSGQGGWKHPWALIGTLLNQTSPLGSAASLWALAGPALNSGLVATLLPGVLGVGGVTMTALVAGNYAMAKATGLACSVAPAMVLERFPLAQTVCSNQTDLPGTLTAKPPFSSQFQIESPWSEIPTAGLHTYATIRVSYEAAKSFLDEGQESSDPKVRGMRPIEAKKLPLQIDETGRAILATKEAITKEVEGVEKIQRRSLYLLEAVAESPVRKRAAWRRLFDKMFGGGGSDREAVARRITEAREIVDEARKRRSPLLGQLR